jgi:hypothetical protein
VVVAAALSLGLLSGCSSEKQDKAAQAPPTVQVEEDGGSNVVTVDHADRFPTMSGWHAPRMNEPNFFTTKERSPGASWKSRTTGNWMRRRPLMRRSSNYIF